MVALSDLVTTQSLGIFASAFLGAFFAFMFTRIGTLVDRLFTRKQKHRTGELAKGIRKATGFKGESTENAMNNLESELADVLMYLMDLANYFNIDLETAYRKKIKINETRQWK